MNLVTAQRVLAHHTTFPGSILVTSIATTVDRNMDREVSQSTDKARSACHSSICQGGCLHAAASCVTDATVS